MTPCTAWTTGADAVGCCSGAEAAALDEFVGLASDVLYEFSGRQFPGSCEVVERPCAQSSGCWGPGGVLGGAIAYVLGWSYTSWAIGGGAAPCGCGYLSEVPLRRPVRSVTEVKVNGVALGAAAYRVDEWSQLVRLDGEAWPGCQNLALADDQPGTFSVTYTYGQSPPAAGVAAANALACELWKACSGGECSLPVGVTSVTRQGITIDRLAFGRFGRLSDGSWATGIPTVDVFLGAYNPHGLRRAPAVLSPDSPRLGRRIGT